MPAVGPKIQTRMKNWRVLNPALSKVVKSANTARFSLVSSTCLSMFSLIQVQPCASLHHSSEVDLPCKDICQLKQGYFTALAGFTMLFFSKNYPSVYQLTCAVISRWDKKTYSSYTAGFVACVLIYEYRLTAIGVFSLYKATVSSLAVPPDEG